MNLSRTKYKHQIQTKTKRTSVRVQRTSTNAMFCMHRQLDFIDLISHFRQDKPSIQSNAWSS